MFEKIKKIFGVGKIDAAALVREVVRGNEAQDILFVPENAHALRAYVLHGHSFDPFYFSTFLEVADRDLVKIYLRMGFELGDREKRAVLGLNDDELTQVMIASGSWAPFPFGGCLHPSGKPHELEAHEQEQEQKLDGVITA